MKSLSSRSRTLKRGWCFLMSSFSRRIASFSERVTITSMSPSSPSSSGMKIRSSPLPASKYCRTRERRLAAFPTYTTAPSRSFMR